MSNFLAPEVRYRLFTGRLKHQEEVLVGTYDSHEKAEEKTRAGFWGKAVSDSVYFRIEKIYVHPSYKEKTQ